MTHGQLIVLIIILVLIILILACILLDMAKLTARVKCLEYHAWRVNQCLDDNMERMAGRIDRMEVENSEMRAVYSLFKENL